MSDDQQRNDLEQFVSEPRHRLPSPVSPGLRFGPRVQGGQPLGGGPRLDLPLEDSTKSVARDDPHAPAGPHFELATPEQEAKPASVPLEAESLDTVPLEGVSLEIATTEDGVMQDGVMEAGATEVSTHTTTVRAAPMPETTTLSPDPGKADIPNEERGETSTSNLLRAVGLKKSYRKGPVDVPVLHGLSLDVRPGEFLAIVGHSGSGKSTLLHLLGTLDAPDEGKIYFEGRRVDNQPAAIRETLRNTRMGMIFQFYHLLPELTTLENVLAPLMITHGTWAYFRQRRQLRKKAEDLLELVGLKHRLKHKPRELSGGEMQRAAIARALISEPDLLLADEPTGNLDHATGEEIMKILRTLNVRHKLTIVMVTHDQAIAETADRIITLTDGRVDA